MLHCNRKKYYRIAYWLEYHESSDNFLFKGKKGYVRSSIKRFKTMKACLRYLNKYNEDNYVLTRLKYTVRGRFILRKWDVINKEIV